MTVGPASIESALARLEALPDANARAVAREAMTAVLQLHREGMERLSKRLREVSPDGEQILQAIAQDEVVASLLSLHQLHPLAVEARVQRALDKVCAESGEAGSIEVISIDQGAVRVRVSGGERLERAVEQAAWEAAPELERVEVLAPARDLVPLSRLVRRRSGSHERCDVCGEAVAQEHAHLFDVERRRLECACIACNVLFDNAQSKLRRVPRKAHRLVDFEINDAQWEALKVPVALAFFSQSSSLGMTTAAYPGPAGAIESVVASAAWVELVKHNAALAELESDVTALLVHRRAAGSRYWILSIDACYRLTGLMRTEWRGLTGGDGPVRALEEFFEGLTESPT